MEFTARKRDGWRCQSKNRLSVKMSLTCAVRSPLVAPFGIFIGVVETQSLRHRTAWCRSSLQSCLAKGHGFQRRPSKPFNRSPILCQAGNPRTTQEILETILDILHISCISQDLPSNLWSQKWNWLGKACIYVHHVMSPRHHALSPRVSKA